MRKRNLSKTVALITAVGLAASSTTVAYAGTGTENAGSAQSTVGDPVTDGTDNAGEEKGQEESATKNVSVSGKKEETTTVDSVSNTDGTAGVEMKDNGEEKLDATVVVKGDVEVSNKDMTSFASDETTGIRIESDGGKANVSVEGDVSAEADANAEKAWYDPSAHSVGISTDGPGSTITVSGNVYAAASNGTALGVLSDGDDTITIGEDVYATSENWSARGIKTLGKADITIGGDVEVTGSDKKSEAKYGDFETGLDVEGNSEGKIDIVGDVTVKGYDANGIYVKTSGSKEGDEKEVNITVGGSVKAESDTSGTGVYISKNDKKLNITVEGDITGTTNGVYVYSNKEDAKIVTGGTLSGENGAAVLVIKPDEDGKTPDITAWKIEGGEDQIVAAYEYDAEAEKYKLNTEYAETVQKAINYIIKAGVAEDGNETANGKIVLSGTSGTVTVGDKTYDTAHQGDRITITVQTVSGYKYSLSNGQAVLKANEDGTYTLEIPAGGGVDLKAVLEKIQEQEESKEQTQDKTQEQEESKAQTQTTTETQSYSNSGSSHSSSSSSDSSTSSSTGTNGTTVSRTLSNGQSVTVLGAATDASGNVTSGLVSNSSSGVSAAVGGAKRAGLPAAVATTLNDIDSGNLGSVPAEAAAAVAGKQVLAQTVALVHITAPTEQKLIMAQAKIPASGVVQVLYYDNTTGRFTVLSATVDAATGIVTFTAPADGTAAIIG